MISFSGDAVFQPVYNNIRTPYRDAPAVVVIFRFGPVGNGGETTSIDGQRRFVNGKGGDGTNITIALIFNCYVEYMPLYWYKVDKFN
jgi:hypothetical protein